ncbi:hypothetical protein QP246_02360 [Aerococcus urinae]|uniref:hypothetical protein n=1 Tax=Aerococcus urinae TaxID=1376 RepID=UPI00254C064A|nr:hypothetical protein [Aerococcus urinae]MDK6688302.1 hypothetical protein [Aerococcus urinae]
MSGGSYAYKYLELQEWYSGQTYDPVLDEIIDDLVVVLHDLEWWQSADYSEDTYRESVTAFKDKWLANGNETYKSVINQEVDKAIRRIGKLKLDMTDIYKEDTP